MNNIQYRIALLSLSFLIIFTSCTKNDFYEDILTCESDSNGSLLYKIEFESENGTLRQHEYVYDKTNQLEVINGKTNGDIYFSYKFFYDFQKRVVQKQSFFVTNGILKRSSVDSFIYDSKSRIIEIKYFYSDTFDNLVLSQINKYTYNKNDMMEKSVHLSKDYKDTINNKINDVRRISKYYWDENNLVKQEDFSKDMRLKHEWTFKYDKKDSPKRTSFNPPFKFQNIQISFSVIDHTGLLDLFVLSKINTLCYNKDGFISKVVRDKGGESYFYRKL